MQSFSETESEPEQFPMDPVVEEQSLEKPKRKRKAKTEPVGDKPDPLPEKPKRVLTEEHKEKMRIAREKAKERRLAGMQKPEPLERKETESPKAEEPEPPAPKPKRKYVRKAKAEEEPKEKVIEVHHHHYEEKPKKTRSKSEPKKEAAAEPKPKKTRAKKEAAEPKPVIPSVDFV